MIKEKLEVNNVIHDISDIFSIKIKLHYSIQTKVYQRKGCTYCKKYNHTIRRCWLLKRKKLKQSCIENNFNEDVDQQIALKIKIFECSRRRFLLCCKKAHQYVKRNYSSSRFWNRLMYEIEQVSSCLKLKY